MRCLDGMWLEFSLKLLKKNTSIKDFFLAFLEDKMYPTIKHVVCVTPHDIGGVFRATNRVPAHFWVERSLFLSGLRVGGPMPSGWTGAHFFVEGSLVIDFASWQDSFDVLQSGRVLNLKPIKDRRFMSVKDVLLPSADTHISGFIEAGSVGTVENGSVLIVGDSERTMKLVLFFFDAGFHSYHEFTCMLGQSEGHMREIWQRRGVLSTTPSVAFGETTHVPHHAEGGIHPIVRDVLLTLHNEALRFGHDIAAMLFARVMEKAEEDVGAKRVRR